MNGPQDMGGRQGFGPGAPEQDEPIFHAEWEKRALALTVAMGAAGAWTLDESRHARESLPPADYLSFSYYQIWFTALTNLMTTHGLITREEAKTGERLTDPKSVKRVLNVDDTFPTLMKGGPTERDTNKSAQFAVGAPVISKVANPSGHTRLPHYAVGRPGTIHAVHGVHVFPDTNAHQGGENPQWLYSVRFRAVDLWGSDTTAADIFIDLWEPYLAAR